MAKKKTTRARTRRKTGRRGKRGLSNVSLADLQAELDRRVEALEERRQELLEELEALDEEIGGHGAAPAAPRRRTAKKRPGRPRKKGTRKKSARRTGGRGQNADSLVDALKKLLNGRTMSVTEMAEEVQKAGYKTSSPNFRTIVNQTLINNKKDFKRVARGQYTAK
jgi:cell division septum initiation protein DivIVA